MGPTAAILFPSPMTDQFQTELVSFLNHKADDTQGDCVWIEARAIVYSTNWGWDDHKESYTGLISLVGWSPESILTLGAMSNRREDHRLLGQLCAEISLRFNGLIEFGALLSDYTKDQSILSCPSHFQNEGTSIVSPSLMSQWLNHTDFRMVK